jgi:hypothetical protein
MLLWPVLNEIASRGRGRLATQAASNQHPPRCILVGLARVLIAALYHDASVNSVLNSSRHAAQFVHIRLLSILPSIEPTRESLPWTPAGASPPMHCGPNPSSPIEKVDQVWRDNNHASAPLPPRLNLLPAQLHNHSLLTVLIYAGALCNPVACGRHLVHAARKPHRT